MTPGQRRGTESVRETVASRLKSFCVLVKAGMKFVAVFLVIYSGDLFTFSLCSVCREIGR